MFTKRSIGNLVAGTYCAAAAVFVLMSVPTTVHSAAATLTPVVSQTPLSVGGNVPGNLLIVPSVEFPTVDSVANLGAYSPSSTFVGYFDSAKCYKYQYYATETSTDKSHFYPTSYATNHACSDAAEWSGNYLNWATTQTIDPFRKALTGGYRVVDTTSTTILEKARSDNQSSASYFPNRRLEDDSHIAGATPASWGDFYTRISRLGNEMHFSRPNSVGAADGGIATTTVYTGAALTNASDNTVYRLAVRVKVCVAGMLEANCVGYPRGGPVTHYKPEGLIQKYSDRIRYSAFGFLNDHDGTRDGGVLRARQKFVGPYTLSFNTTDGWLQSTNPAAEWNSDGILVQNPDSADATATTSVISSGNGYTATQHAIVNSGVINYINKFGQMTTKNHKALDPVSELYYTAIRYLKNQGNVSEYTNLTGSALNRFEFADGFPVITTWNDPIQYACQNNAILGIGDVYTHRDKNLPGSGTSTSDEPATKPAAVSNDTTVNVRTATEKVFAMEGLTINTAAASWSGRSNSAFIAGLAYDSHTTDLRPDVSWPSLPGKQTVSTYWVDVRENQRLEDRNANQYWLAAKYGGFDVPDDFQPYAATTTSLPAGSWESGETLMHWGGATHNVSRPRPENFYVASEADEMIASLTRAFANIVAESKGSASSLAANSTRLDTETRTFQAQFFSGIWGGELNAYSVDANGRLSAAPVWNATDDMLAAGDTWDDRRILVNTDADADLEAFTWSNLTIGQRANLVSEDVVNYIRGERTNEESYANGTLRVRGSILGDIVNSTPLFIGAPNPTLHAGRSYLGGNTYSTWATAADRTGRTPIVYVGANDGMLHAFNANTGVEVFAFVPNAVIEKGLASYADPVYEHKFFVDGETAAAEIYDTATGTWRTVLVGTLGRGGPGIFALDVTDPAAPTLLWELDGDDIPQLGKNIGRPVIAQVANGDWRVLLGNGPDSGTGAHLITIRLGSASNGAVTTIEADPSADNGLSALLVRDSNSDSYADIAYAGDLEGTVWKFSAIASASPTKLELFHATDPSNARQPITAAPIVARDPATATLWVFVGTGKYLNEDDLSDKQVQTWYGLMDTGAAIASRAELVDRDITVETVVGGNPARVIERGTSGDLAGMKGWYIDLVSPAANPADGIRGERMVVQNRFQGEALIGTTRIPTLTDPCRPGGSGFVMAINPFTGARLANTFFDMNGDGISNDADKYFQVDEDAEGEDGELNGRYIVVSGFGFESSPNNPIFIENVMQVGLDDGTTEVVEIFGSSVEASRMSWRELFNN